METVKESMTLDELRYMTLEFDLTEDEFDDYALRWKLKFLNQGGKPYIKLPNEHLMLEVYRVLSFKESFNEDDAACMLRCRSLWSDCFPLAYILKEQVEFHKAICGIK